MVYRVLTAIFLLIEFYQVVAETPALAQDHCEHIIESVFDCECNNDMGSCQNISNFTQILMDSILCNTSSKYEEATSSFTMSPAASSSFSSLEYLVGTTLTSESFPCQNNSNNPAVDQENINQELIIFLIILAIGFLGSFGLNFIFCLISLLIWKRRNREKLVLTDSVDASMELSRSRFGRKLSQVQNQLEESDENEPNGKAVDQTDSAAPMYATVHKEPSVPDEPPPLPPLLRTMSLISRKDCCILKNDGYKAGNEVSNSVQDPVYQDIPGNAGLSKENRDSLGKRASMYEVPLSVKNSNNHHNDIDVINTKHEDN